MKSTISVLVLLLLILGVNGELFGVEILEPKNGTIFAPGATVTVKAQASPGENVRLVHFYTDLRSEEHSEPFDLIPPYTWEFILPKEHIGTVEIIADGVPVKGSESVASNSSVTITVILPPTTKVVSIGASFDGRKETFLEIARKPSRELVVTEGTHSTNTVSVGARYSDGVGRTILNNPNVTYKSLNEKVAIVIPVGQKGNKYDELALVKATGPGKTDIIVQYGELTDRVTVHVKECPYIEGETDKHGCPLR